MVDDARQSIVPLTRMTREPPIIGKAMHSVYSASTSRPRHARPMVASVLAAVFLFSCAWAVHSQTAKPPGPLAIAQVRGDLSVITGEGGNVAVYVTPEGVVLVDDMFYRNHADILAKVRAITDRPLRYVINTHQHDDHAGGNAMMLPLAEVIAHQNVYANLKDIKRPYYEDT